MRPWEIVDLARGFHKSHIGACFDLQLGPAHRLIQTMHGKGVRACNHEEIIRLAGLDGGPYFFGDFLVGNHSLALEMATALGKHLILIL